MYKQADKLKPGDRVQTQNGVKTVLEVTVKETAPRVVIDWRGGSWTIVLRTLMFEVERGLNAEGS